MGYPRVFQDNPHLYLSKPIPTSIGAGFAKTWGYITHGWVHHKYWQGKYIIIIYNDEGEISSSSLKVHINVDKEGYALLNASKLEQWHNREGHTPSCHVKNPVQIIPPFGGILAGVGGDVAVCRVGCTCGWCWPWWTSCVHQCNVSQVWMSGTGRHHDDVAGNDLEEIQKVC